jgi:TPR repeat protein
MRPLGFGLDETAIEAVRQWRFRPATKDGKAVNVQATIEVNFVLNPDNPQTVEQLEKIAAGSDSAAGPALVELAKLAFRRNPADLEKGVGYLKRASELGFAPAQWELAFCLFHGRGVRKDEKKAFEWAKRSADQGSPEGLNLVGWAYRTGTGAKRNQEEAYRYFLQGAEKGSAAAMFNLGALYETKVVGEPDFEKAAYWHRRAADRGMPGAQWRLGMLLAQGKAVPAGPWEASAWLLLAARAGVKEGEPELQKELAKLSPADRKLAESFAGNFRPRPQ